MTSFANAAGTLTRRELIRRSLLLGASGYVAPLVLGSAVPASAQIVSSIPCNNPGCGGFGVFRVLQTGFPGSCGQGLCTCVNTAGGGTACVDPYCGGKSCTSNSDCQAGWVCFTEGCCELTVRSGQPGLNLCIPLCGNAPIP